MAPAVSVPVSPVSVERSAAAATLRTVTDRTRGLINSLDVDNPSATSEKYRKLVDAGVLTDAIEGARLASQQLTTFEEGKSFAPLVDRFVVTPLTDASSMDASGQTSRARLAQKFITASEASRHAADGLDPLTVAQ
jgi:hypothetical protein